MIIIARDVTDPTTPPFLTADIFVTNPDGTQALKLLTGSYAYQMPPEGNDPYGKFGSSPNPDGAYQECKVEGQLVSWWTRAQDKPYVYTWMTVPTR